MRKYKHWLKIDAKKNKREVTIKQWKNLKEYIGKYPNSKITVFNSEVDIFVKYISLECEQEYNDLDLHVNSLFDGSITRLTRKPTNIENCPKTFEEIYTHYTKVS